MAEVKKLAGKMSRANWTKKGLNGQVSKPEPDQAPLPDPRMFPSELLRDCASEWVRRVKAAKSILDLDTSRPE